MFPEIHNKTPQDPQDRLDELKIQLIPIPVEMDQREFKFRVELTALGIAETLADGQRNFLAWMDARTLEINEPKDFLLPVEFELA